MQWLKKLRKVLGLLRMETLKQWFLCKLFRNQKDLETSMRLHKGELDLIKAATSAKAQVAMFLG